MKKVPAQKRSRRASSSIYAPFHQQIKSTYLSTANKIVPSILVAHTDIAT
jgi:hypothetical protein